MTHPTSLPNGFSTDFSEAPRGRNFAIYVYEEGAIYRGIGRIDRDEGVFWCVPGEAWYKASRPLCWCPIPTPGDAVLNELAEEGK